MKTDAPEYTIFTADERAFLERMFDTYPHIGEKFDHFLNIPAFTRPIVAGYATSDVERAGWVKRNVPNPERVTEHMVSAGRLAFVVPAPEGVDPFKAAMMLRLHDIAEVVVGDFTPHDTITKDDKHRLELLAAQALFEAHTEGYETIKEYTEQQTTLSHFVHDLDKLDAVCRAVHYEAKYPEKEGQLFAEFADYTGPRLKTDGARQFFADLAKDPAALIQQLRDDFAASQQKA